MPRRPRPPPGHAAAPHRLLAGLPRHQEEREIYQDVVAHRRQLLQEVSGASQPLCEPEQCGKQPERLRVWAFAKISFLLKHAQAHTAQKARQPRAARSQEPAQTAERVQASSAGRTELSSISTCLPTRRTAVRSLPSSPSPACGDRGRGEGERGMSGCGSAEVGRGRFAGAVLGRGMPTPETISLCRAACVAQRTQPSAISTVARAISAEFSEICACLHMQQRNTMSFVRIPADC